MKETQRGERNRWKAVVMVGDGPSDRYDQNMTTNERAVTCATGKAYRQGLHVGRGSWEMKLYPYYSIL